MKQAACVLAGLALAASVCAAPASPGQAGFEGDWLAPAENADDVDALIHLSPKGALWEGSIKAIIVTRPDQAYRNDTPCTACTGRFRGQPLQGLLVLWGFKAQGGRLVDGHILDPEDGRVYDGEITLSADGRTAEVLAYKGLKLLGHAMTWRQN